MSPEETWLISERQRLSTQLLDLEQQVNQGQTGLQSSLRRVVERLKFVDGRIKEIEASCQNKHGSDKLRKRAKLAALVALPLGAAFFLWRSR